MEGSDESPAIKINEKCIKAAQEEIGKLDVLVCGECHSVFHFINEFQEHQSKADACSKQSKLRDNNESKAKVWAFLLWKDSQIQTEPDKDNTWQLYNKWIAMDAHTRDSWIAAGKTIQIFTKISNSKMHDIATQGTATEGGKTVVVRKVIRNGQPISPNKSNLKPGLTEKKVKSTNESGEHSSEEDFNVEKILAKRFNPKKKCYEYLLKWEGYAHEYNTWEEVNHVSSTCKALMDEFEKNLAKQKEMKAQQVAKTANRSGQLNVTQKFIKTENIKAGTNATPSGSTNRPMRSSKSKAMDQVKQWCGSMKEEENELLGKRKNTFSDSDSDEGLTTLNMKRSKVDTSGDDWTADSEEDKVVIGRSDVIQRALNRANIQSNGSNRGPLTGSALAKEAVQKEMKLGNASNSNVYVVHRKDGIIKLDSTPTNKIAVKGQNQTPTSNVLVLPSREGFVKKQVISPNSITPIKVISKPDGTQIVTQMKVVSKGSPSGMSIKNEPVKIQPKPDNNQMQYHVVTAIPSPLSHHTTTTTTVVKPGGQRQIVSRPSSGVVRNSPLGTVSSQQRAPVRPNVPRNLTPQQIAAQRKNLASPQITPLAKPKITVINNQGKPVRTVNNTVSQQVTKSTPGKNPVTPTQKMLDARKKFAEDARKPVQRVLGSKGGPNAVRPKGKPANEPGNKPKESKLAETDGLHMEFHEVSDEEESSEEEVPPPFPEPEPAPAEPESPTREFTLCPLTGRIIGPDGQPVEQPEPEPTPVTTSSTTAPTPMAIISNPTVTATIGPDGIIANTSASSELVLPSLDTCTDNNVGGVRVEMSPGGTTGMIVPTDKPSTSETMTISGVPGPDLPCLDDPNVEMQPPTQTTGNQPNQTPQVPQIVTSDGLVVPASDISQETSILPEVQPPQEAAELPQTSTATIAAPTATTVTSNLNLEENNGLVTITGDDGVVYQVTGEGEDGQTILVTRGPDGEQQLYVTTTEQQGEVGGTMLTLDHAVAEAVAQMGPDQAVAPQFYVKEGAEGAVVENTQTTSSNEQQVVMSIVDNSSSPVVVANAHSTTEEGENQVQCVTQVMQGDEGENQAQVVAQVIQADEPSPDGTRKVVLLLPDGNLIMTEVDEEQYAALELDK
ncbi:flocculation protein FLO11 isoform X1 [Trichogramma pretiosum]|uniref:flocculation protein FLO11 isoform X1 n=1 Tax=Trichogramma pretiosum TaxID=7493 RepID=UPI0006C966DB|nr:flocculation protein FLO11 isoform X1 [Trichogramma pretiosum]XP_014225006.1 flocculation protein FLO11 isoform X1 [Trichogramma pretiosum]XP_014225007.1 flocculation protein FLO11 isoform X1 [Trichogramma pretiosum]XP_014225008.1 flocculation protein FLO11 isoform X1 [Trichogramma pretiosum]